MKKVKILLYASLIAIGVPLSLFTLEALFNPATVDEIPPHETCETLDPNGFYQGVCIDASQGGNVCEFYTISQNTWTVPATTPPIGTPPYFIKTPDMNISDLVDCSYFAAFNSENWQLLKTKQSPPSYVIKNSVSPLPKDHETFYRKKGTLTINFHEPSYKNLQYLKMIKAFIDEKKLGKTQEITLETATLIVDNMSLVDCFFIKQFYAPYEVGTMSFSNKDHELVFINE